jgi:hypothetical protein
MWRIISAYGTADGFISDHYWKVENEAYMSPP